MFVIQTFINFDSGLVPSSLVDIQRTLSLSFLSQGILGAVVYAGLSGSSIFAGHIFYKHDCKWVLVWTILLNGISCMVFSLSPNAISMIFFRLIMGISQAFPVIYAPIWVDQFAPSRRKTMWMSLMYICSPLGIMFGFGAGIIFADEQASPERWWALWRIPTLIQGAALVLFSLLLSMVPEHLIDGRDEVEPQASMSTTQIQRWKSKLSVRRQKCEVRLKSLAGLVNQDEDPAWKKLIR